MINCNNCQRVKNILNCINDLVIGTVSSTETGVYVYFQDQRGRLDRVSAVTSAGGLITLTDFPLSVMTGMKYHVWVTLQTAESLEDQEDITISGDAENTFTCLQVEFNKAYASGVAVTGADQTLEKA